MLLFVPSGCMVGRGDGDVIRGHGNGDVSIEICREAWQWKGKRNMF